MPLRPLPYRQVKRKLEAAGFVVKAQCGSHVKFVRDTPKTTLTVIVPQHHEIAIGTLRGILRQAALSVAEFEAL